MSAGNVDALAERVLLLATLRARIERLEKQAKTELAQAIPPGTTLKPLLANEPLGSINRTVSSTYASVSDPEAFAEWVEAHYPQNVDLRPIVKPAVIEAVLNMSREAGVPVGLGGECGPDGPPGIRVIEGGGTMSARPNRDAMPALWAAIRDRLPELTSGDE